MTRRYAEDTSVPVSRSRGEIDTLLRTWGAQGIQWTDDFQRERVLLRFAWTRGEQRYMARFALNVEPEAKVRERCTYRQGFSEPKLAEAKYRDAMAKRGAPEHRLLVLWLKAVFNAVEAGLIDAETIFLPFFEDRNGQTVAEMALPRLGLLLEGSAARLLGDGR